MGSKLFMHPKIAALFAMASLSSMVAPNKAPPPASSEPEAETRQQRRKRQRQQAKGTWR